MTRKILFPDVEPTRFGHLPVGGIHQIYWEELGNPDGLPVIFLHGGPGSGIAKTHRRFFDPSAYRIVLFDQRGAGKSWPVADTRENTTADLVSDIEALRTHLSIEEWLVFGGSWGSTLALAYGESYPARCLGFVLRGIFLGRRSEIDWFLYGMGQIFPEAHRKLLEHLPKYDRGNLLGAYRRILDDPDPAVHMPAARVWSGYEAACSSLHPVEETVGPVPSEDQMLALARLEVHYFTHNMFLESNALLEGLPAILQKPVIIVQGRYDIICPIRTADELARAWVGAKYVVVSAAGHSAMEPGILAALIRATEYFKSRLRP
ncbi:MAG: prolyl aminopeptidase [Rhodospirillaceae bacterium]|nr:prolyl aminopeptidase [Rhodospirillaceae bacterium]